MGEMLKQIEGNEDQLALFVAERINSGAYRMEDTNAETGNVSDIGGDDPGSIQVEN